MTAHIATYLGPAVGPPTQERTLWRLDPPHDYPERTTPIDYVVVARTLAHTHASDHTHMLTIDIHPANPYGEITSLARLRGSTAITAESLVQLLIDSTATARIDKALTELGYVPYRPDPYAFDSDPLYIPPPPPATQPQSMKP